VWFKKLTVRNVGPFEALDLEFTRGSVGIFGKNGCGKSTVLNLLYAVLTNDFGRFDGVKTDMVRLKVQNEKGVESWVRGDIEHNGKQISITRNMKPTKAKPNTSAVIDGEEFNNADKAEAAIYAALGVDRKLLDLYVFKEQHRIYDFLTTEPAERAKAYQTLCRTEACEQIWDSLGEFLNKDKDVNIQITDNSDELQQAISEAKAEVEVIEKKQIAAEDKLCSEKAKAKYDAVIQAQRMLEHYREQEPIAKAKVQACEEALTKAKKRHATKKEEYDEVRGKVDKRSRKADDTRAALKAWESYRAYRKRRKALREEAEALEEEAKKNPTPLPPADPLEAAEKLNKQLINWEAELERAKKTVDVFGKTGRTECPTCYTPVADLSNHLAEMKKTVAELPAKIKGYMDRVEALDNYRSAARKHEKWKAGYDARLKANQDAREALKEITAPDGDRDALQQWLDEYAADVERAKSDETAVKTLKDEVTRCEANLAAAQEKLAEVAAGVESSTSDPAAVEKATRRLAEHTLATSEIAALGGELKGLTKLAAEKEVELGKLRKKLKRSRKIRQMAEVIRKAREVMHRDRLPRRVAVSNLGQMEGDVNVGLEQFGSPFWVEANGELSFTVHKAGDPPQAAGRLSTGQRVVLALSFWPAVASLWESDLGMLALDEPTANLDADNRKFLAQALGAMTAKVRGHRQLIMVTHDPDLRTSFDQVIDLGV
jgi:DNA repair exonuclease SbcCD ATPase subunit